MTQALNVEYQELMARAAEIEAPLPALPIGNPQSPCALSFVRDTAVQIAINADSLRLYIRACEREWRTLATSLRNAAKAYEEVDEAAAENIDAVNMDGSTSGAAAGLVSADGIDDMSLSDLDSLPASVAAAPFQYPYYEVRQAAADITSPDQGVAFKAFASAWNKYQLAFQQLSYRFRPFLNWEGDARAAVEGNFSQQRQWILGMVSQCTMLAKQAQMVADAHKKITPSGAKPDNPTHEWGQEGEHPAPYEVSQCDAWYKYYVENNSPHLPLAIEWYTKLQKRSETALASYISYAGIPLAPLNPSAPYGAYIIKAPATGDGGGDSSGPDIPDPGDIPTGDDLTGDDLTGDDLTGSYPSTPSLPTMPTAGAGATPATPDTKAMVDSAMKKAGLPTGGAGGGVKPASLGGGGGAGMPKMPLQPATAGDAAPRPAAAAPGLATEGLGKGLPGAGGTGGGGMGGMPMGGQGGKGDAKGKRVESEDESLYTEERAWTEGVIGNRPRKGPSEK
jgi:hypothetical protein